MTDRRLLAAAAVAVVLLAGCDAAASVADLRAERARHAEEVTIAAVWPWQERSEILYAEGLQMAVDEVNAAGGIDGRRLRLLRRDDRGSVNDGLLVAQQLADDPDVVAVIGHLQSYVTVPAAAVYDLGGLVLLSPTSTSPELTTQGYTRVFRSIFTDQNTGRQMAEYAASRGYERVAIYYVRNPYGRALANAFEERAAEVGLRVAARASYATTGEDRSFDATLREWAQTDLDAVFIAGQVPDAGALIRRLREYGIDAPVLGGDAMSSPALVSAGGEAVEGTVVASVFHPDEPRPEVRRFVEAFRERYGRDPDPGSALGYDAVHLLADAIRRAGTPEPDAVARSLRELRRTGVTGTLAFDGDGNLASPRLVRLVVRGGRFEYLPDRTLTSNEPSGPGHDG